MREALKEQLREELWGHITLLYEEERAAGMTPGEARKSACKRLGDADYLAEACAYGESVETRLVRWLTIRDITPRAVLRAFGRSSLAFLLLAMASVGLPGMTLATALVSWTTVSMLLAVVFFGGTLAAVEARASRMMLIRSTPWRAGATVLAWRLAIATIQGAAVALLAWLAGYAFSAALCAALDHDELLAVVELFGAEVLLRATVLPPIGVALGWLFVWREHQARALQDWPYLDFPSGEA